MDPVTAWEHPGFASSDPAGIAVAAVKGDATLADLVLWDAATGDTIIRAFGVGGAVKFQNSAGAAGGIAWTDVSKVGSSLLDLATRDASALDSGLLLSARLAGAYTGITTVGTLTSLTVTGTVDALNGINLGAGGAQGIISWGAAPYLRGAVGKGAGLYGGGGANGITVDASGVASLSSNLLVAGITALGSAATTGLSSGEMAIANGKRIVFRDTTGVALVINADAASAFVLNLNTGSTSGSGGYVRIPFTSAPATASSALNGVIGIDEPSHKFYFISGGVRYGVTGVSY